VAEKSATAILSLPMYPHLEHSQQKRVVEKIIAALAESPISISNRVAESHPSADLAPVAAGALAGETGVVAASLRQS
jgi:hypothetical protein